MSYSLTITEDQVFTALQSFLQALTGAAEVWKADDNRVPMPNAPFIAMTPVGRIRISTNVETTQDGLTTSMESQPTRFSIQVDCYGASSGDWAQIIATAWRSDIGATFLDPLGVDPLYADDAKFQSFVNGEQQFEPRWTLTLHLQANIALLAPQQYMSTAKINLTNVSTIH